MPSSRSALPCRSALWCLYAESLEVGHGTTPHGNRTYTVFVKRSSMNERCIRVDSLPLVQDRRNSLNTEIVLAESYQVATR